MRLSVGRDPDDAARLAAEEIARVCTATIAAHGRVLLALSGGTTPWRMIEQWRAFPLDWSRVHVAQVDERIAPRSDPRRNLAPLETLLVYEGRLPQANLHRLPVDAEDVESAARSFQQTLERQFGAPLRFDLVQLGLGADGHTASLVPGDGVLEVADRDVAVTSAPYEGLRRMTLTYPALNRARRRLWLVTGAAKSRRLAELLTRAGSSPAVRVAEARSVVFADTEAARDLSGVMGNGASPGTGGAP